MGEIDDAHHAEDDRKPARAQHPKGACVSKLVKQANDGVEHGATCRGAKNWDPTGHSSRRSLQRRRALSCLAASPQPLGGGLLGVYWALGFFLVRSQPASPSQ